MVFPIVSSSFPRQSPSPRTHPEAYGALSGELLAPLRLPAAAPLAALRRAVAAALEESPVDARCGGVQGELTMEKWDIHGYIHSMGNIEIL